mmetsp:Transcript_16728/g.67481  ORF Transcript_16728/g.67481 Transcript_16728/m.67481 type:complete len:360 (+) Transcript_16728:647-1726(+)
MESRAPAAWRSASTSRPGRQRELLMPTVPCLSGGSSWVVVSYAFVAWCATRTTNPNIAPTGRSRTTRGSAASASARPRSPSEQRRTCARTHDDREAARLPSSAGRASRSRDSTPWARTFSASSTPWPPRPRAASHARRLEPLRRADLAAAPTTSDPRRAPSCTATSSASRRRTRRVPAAGVPERDDRAHRVRRDRALASDGPRRAPVRPDGLSDPRRDDQDPRAAGRPLRPVHGPRVRDAPRPRRAPRAARGVRVDYVRLRGVGDEAWRQRDPGHLRVRLEEAASQGDDDGARRLVACENRTGDVVACPPDELAFLPPPPPWLVARAQDAPLRRLSRPRRPRRAALYGLESLGRKRCCV